MTFVVFSIQGSCFLRQITFLLSACGSVTTVNTFVTRKIIFLFVTCISCTVVVVVWNYYFYMSYPTCFSSTRQTLNFCRLDESINVKESGCIFRYSDNFISAYCVLVLSGSISTAFIAFGDEAHACKTLYVLYSSWHRHIICIHWLLLGLLYSIVCFSTGKASNVL